MSDYRTVSFVYFDPIEGWQTNVMVIDIEKVDYFHLEVDFGPSNAVIMLNNMPIYVYETGEELAAMFRGKLPKNMDSGECQDG